MNEQQKLNEADFFYAQMVKETNAPDNFKHNLSAFMTAARSVLQYAEKEARTKGGQSWYVKTMQQSQLLQFFRDKRNIEVHEEPVRPSQNVTIELQATLRMSSTLSIAKIDAEGNIVEEYPSPPEPPAPMPPEKPPIVTYSYRFADWSGTEDVVTLAGLYLQELKRLANDGFAQGFLTP